jgi:hypothetical protein
LVVRLIVGTNIVGVVSEPDAGADRRLFNMIQHLMILAANDKRPEAGPPRDVVTQDDAVDAVLVLAAFIDEATQAGRVPAERGIGAAAMLMIIRDYIRPLPLVPGDDGADRVKPDLAELVATLREAGGSAGVKG